MLETFRTLMKYGARLDPVDSEGMLVLHHAIKKNNLPLVRYILANSQELTDQRDSEGRTAVHMCVQPYAFGSFENVSMLRLLHETGHDLAAPDKKGQTPLDYAMHQDSKVMAKELTRLMQSFVDLSISLRRNSVTPAIEWPEFACDFSEDAQNFLEQAEKRRNIEVFEEKNELDYVPLDREFAGEKQYKVYYDEAKRPWDVYMTKIDLRNGPYGDYVFYKMQMIYDSNRELYIVLTRYGRIGEIGMHQRSPFNDVDEAK